MIFDAETRRHWRPTKMDYKAGDRVKVIDTREWPGLRLGQIGTVTSNEKADGGVLVRFESDLMDDALFYDEIRPADDDEVSTPLPAGMGVKHLKDHGIPFGWKCILVGVMKPGRQ